MNARETIQELSDRLQYAVDTLKRNPVQPSKQWLADTEWLLFSIRKEELDSAFLLEEAKAIRKKSRRIQDILSDIDWHMRDMSDSIAELRDEID